MRFLTVGCTIGLLLAALGTGVPSLAQSSEKNGSAWFDMDNCAMCKLMGDHEKLMTEVEWETHVIDQGMLSVAMIPKKHQQTMQHVHQEMEKVAKELESGKDHELCGFCVRYGEILHLGAREQQIPTSFGMVSMVTSDDPQVVDQIQKFAKRTAEEYAKMRKAGESN